MHHFYFNNTCSTFASGSTAAASLQQGALLYLESTAGQAQDVVSRLLGESLDFVGRRQAVLSARTPPFLLLHFLPAHSSSHLLLFLSRQISTAGAGLISLLCHRRCRFAASVQLVLLCRRTDVPRLRLVLNTDLVAIVGDSTLTPMTPVTLKISLYQTVLLNIYGLWWEGGTEQPVILRFPRSVMVSVEFLPLLDFR